MWSAHEPGHAWFGLQRAAPWLVLAGAVLVVELGLREPAGPAVDVPEPALLADVVERVREVPLAAIEDPAAAAIVSGIVFGRTGTLAAADEQAFLGSGLWHLLAASGQNVALLVGCCVVLVRAVGATRVAGSVLALVAIPAYVLVVGGGASIVRAAIVAELVLLAWLAGRLPDPRHVLVVAAAAICAAWPGAHRGLGMQLSFACAAALVLWAGPLQRGLRERGVPQLLATGIAATTLCGLATAPILLARTGSVPFAGMLANLLAVPLAAVVLVVGLAGVALALLEPSAGGLVLEGVGQLARLLLQLAHRGAALPFAQASSPLVGYVLPAAALGLVVTHRIAARRRLGPGAGRFLALAIAALGAVVLAADGVGAGDEPRHDYPPPRAGQVRIAVLDVGQGDATIVATSRHAILVDTGPPGGRIVERVRRAGVRRIDGIVLTHDSLDHRGGFDEALSRLDPDWVAMPRAAPGPWRRVREQAPRMLELCAGSRLQLDSDVLVDVLHPRCDGTITPRTGDLHNDGALVLRVRHRNVVALLPSDAEAPVLTTLPLGAVDLLRVAHHGSADPALPALLDRAAPALAVISVGADNTYGHPVEPVLRELGDRRIDVRRTDRHGTVAVDSDGDRLVLLG